MRLIDADALIAEYDRVHVGPPGGARKLIENAPTVAAPSPWISVEEALPETIACAAGTAYSEAVIVWTDGKKALTAVWNGETFLCDADYWEAWGEHITHWMPLPRPLPEVTQP